MVRGEIWWAQLPLPRGSEPAKRRPVLILQADSFNRSAINTIVCAAITTNLGLLNVPGTVHLSKKESRLPKESIINLSQIVTLDKSFLIECVGAIDRPKLEEVNDRLKTVLDMRD